MSRRARAVAMPSLSSATGWVLGAGAGLGLFPVAPATAASLAAVLVYGFSPLPEDSYGLFILVGAGFLAGVWAVGTLMSKEDPASPPARGRLRINLTSPPGRGRLRGGLPRSTTAHVTPGLGRCDA